MTKWGRVGFGVALAYCHLPIIVAAAAVGRIKLECLAVVAAVPWIGMAVPFLIFVLALAFLVVPGIASGTPLEILSGDTGILIIGLATAALFLLAYAFGLSRLTSPITPVRKRFAILLITWTVVANIPLLIVTPRPCLAVA